MTAFAAASMREGRLKQFSDETDIGKQAMFTELLDENVQLQADLHASHAQLKKAQRTIALQQKQLKDTIQNLQNQKFELLNSNEKQTKDLLNTHYEETKNLEHQITTIKTQLYNQENSLKAYKNENELLKLQHQRRDELMIQALNAVKVNINQAMHHPTTKSSSSSSSNSGNSSRRKKKS